MKLHNEKGGLKCPSKQVSPIWLITAATVWGERLKRWLTLDSPHNPESSLTRIYQTSVLGMRDLLSRIYPHYLYSRFVLAIISSASSVDKAENEEHTLGVSQTPQNHWSVHSCGRVVYLWVYQQPRHLQQRYAAGELLLSTGEMHTRVFCYKQKLQQELLGMRCYKLLLGYGGIVGAVVSWEPFCIVGRDLRVTGHFSAIVDGC